ncbi:MAG: hypothetical protein P8X90_05520 [Desulfobacterales bacterium]|jgi:hypothetical protein
MSTIIFDIVSAGCLVMFGAMLYNAFFRLPKKLKENKPLPMEFYLYKIARLTGKSEYDVFCKSAEAWPVSKARIDQDFKRYLSDQSIPHYVTDFIRKNKEHIDELHIPPF